MKTRTEHFIELLHPVDWIRLIDLYSDYNFRNGIHRYKYMQLTRNENGIRYNDIQSTIYNNIYTSYTLHTIPWHNLMNIRSLFFIVISSKVSFTCIFVFIIHSVSNLIFSSEKDSYLTDGKYWKWYIKLYTSFLVEFFSIIKMCVICASNIASIGIKSVLDQKRLHPYIFSSVRLNIWFYKIAPNGSELISYYLLENVNSVWFSWNKVHILW